MVSRPTLWIVAGPNGVGKTTYAFRHIRAVTGSVNFVNLDEIARGLSPLEPEAARATAARVALRRIDDLIDGRRTFSIETTLSGRTHLRTIEKARRQGFGLSLLFFSVADPETCVARVARRVSEGGHDVPADDIRRRFARGIDNFRSYAGAVDLWRAFDVNGPALKTIAEGRRGCRSILSDACTVAPDLCRVLEAMPPCAEAG